MNNKIIKCFDPFCEKIHSNKRRKITCTLSHKLTEAGIPFAEDDMICDSCRLRVSAGKIKEKEENHPAQTVHENDYDKENKNYIDEVC